MKQKSVADLLTHTEFEFCKEMLKKYDDAHDCLDLYAKDEKEVEKFRKHILKVFSLLSDRSSTLFKISEKIRCFEVPETTKPKELKC